MINDFGVYLREKRMKKGFTISQLSLYSGVSTAQLSRIENGKRGAPKAENLQKIASALSVPYEEMLEAAGYIEDANFDKDKITVAGQEITLTTEELQLFNELKKHPIMFHDLASNPQKKVKELIKLYKMKKILLEDDDEENEEGFGDFED